MLIAGSSYWFARNKALVFARSGREKNHSRAGYHGFYVLLCSSVPAVIFLALWSMAEPFVIKSSLIDSITAQYGEIAADEISIRYTEIANIASGVLKPVDEAGAALADEYKAIHSTSTIAKAMLFIAVLLAGALFGYLKLRPTFKARDNVEKFLRVFLFFSSGVAICTTIGIVATLIFESLRFFELVPITEFLFGTKWSPQIAMRADQAGSSGAFGAIPLFVGTLQIAFLAMLVAVPVGLLAAIYLAEYASATTRRIVKPLLEILAGIPTVVYGFFAALTVAPFVRDLGTAAGLSTSSESALAAGVVMGVMIIPFVSSLSDDVISAVPQSLREASLGLGATKSETIKKVVFPAALPGIAGSILLAVSRAIGETMIVVMAAGLAANLTVNPLANVTTVTVQIVTILVGDQEFDSAKTLAAFALGLMLFVVTLMLNILALHIVKKYREKYD